MNRTPQRLLLACVLLLCAPALPAYAQTTTVILVRHAEKVDDSADAALSAAGLRRADALALALADAGVQAVFTTQYQRTRDTAAPLVQRLGLAPQVLAAAGGTAAHAAQVADRVRQHAGRTVLVVGHSNTVPAIIAALGGPELVIADDEYANLFVLQLSDAGTRLIRGRY
jgi:broad specificity phosphatase PhoE